jgi:rhodanese-related sulfurtransferase
VLSFCRNRAQRKIFKYYFETGVYPKPLGAQRTIMGRRYKQRAKVVHLFGLGKMESRLDSLSADRNSADWCRCKLHGHRPVEPRKIMDSPAHILKTAAERGRQHGLTYCGALRPDEAHELLRTLPGARLVDVRTRAEWDFVGRIPGSVQIEWQTYPGSRPNPEFLKELGAQVDPEAVVMFLCRSGARSHAAATTAAQAGYGQSYNVLEGFEGDKDAKGHRNTVGGWRAAGLPWEQS